MTYTTCEECRWSQYCRQTDFHPATTCRDVKEAIANYPNDIENIGDFRKVIRLTERKRRHNNVEYKRVTPHKVAPERVTRVCQHCGKHFEVIPSKGNAKYCGLKCYGAVLAAQWQERKAERELLNHQSICKGLELFVQSRPAVCP